VNDGNPPADQVAESLPLQRSGSPVTVPEQTSASPYRGFWPYEESDEPAFHGRADVATALIKRLGVGGGDALLVLAGASGVGKTSLIRAGLLPRIAAGDLGEAGSAQWPRRVITPGRRPMAALAETIATLRVGDGDRVGSIAGDGVGDSDSESDSDSDSDSVGIGSDERDGSGDGVGDSSGDCVGGRVGGRVGDVTAALAVAPKSAPDLVAEALGGDRLILVVDQLEEVFTLGDESADFLDAMVALAMAPCRAAIVILVVRGDFWHRCADHPALGPLLDSTQFTLLPMAEDQLREAIVASGVEVDGALVDAVVADMRPDPTLPMFSQAMHKTWETRTGTALTLADYHRIGGLSRVVDVGAAAAFGRLTSAQQVVAPGLLAQLTTITGGRRHRIEVPVDELHAWAAGASVDRDDVDAILDTFVAERLLIRGADTASIAHDVLLTRWDLLRSPLSDTEDLPLKSDPETLPQKNDPGAHPRESDPIALPQKNDPDAHPRENDPVALPRQNHPDAHMRENDPIVLPHKSHSDELPHQNDPGTLPQKSDAVALLRKSDAIALPRKGTVARRPGRRRRITGVVALVTAVVLAAGAAFAGSRSAAEADDQRDTAVSRQLAEQARALVTTDPRTARTLAAIAIRIAPTPDAIGAARDVLARSPAVMIGHDKSVLAVAVSPDGRTVASAGNDGVVGLWNLATGTPTGVPLPGHSGIVRSLAFSADGRIVVSAGSDGAVRLWSVADGSAIGTPLAGHAGADIFAVAISPDGRTIATGDGDRHLQLWSMTSHTPIGAPLVGDAGPIDDVAFTADGRTLVSAGTTGRTQIWNVATRRKIATLPTGRPGGVVSLAVGRGDVLAVAGSGGVQLWDLPRRTRIRSSPATSPVFDIAVSPDGRQYATAENDGTVRVWNTADARPLKSFTGHTGAVRSVTFAPDGRTVVSGGADGTVRRWNLADPAALAHLDVRPDTLTAIALSPDGDVLAGAGPEGVRLLSAAGRKPIGPPFGTAKGLAFSPDGQLLATAGSDKTIRLWDVASRRQRGAAITGPVSAVAFSPDGMLLASAGVDETVRLWDVTTGKPFGPPMRGHSVAFSPDGRLLASAADDGTVRFWDPATGKPDGPPMTGSTGPIQLIAFSPDGTSLVSTDDSTVRLWDVRSRRPIGAPLLGHRNRVGGASFSPDGGTLATSGEDGTIRLWDVASHVQIGPQLLSPGGPVRSVTFLRDGVTLAATGADGTVRFWGAPSARTLTGAQLTQSLCTVAGAPFTRDEWSAYVRDEPFRRIC
jgi:WD40 repeat protein